MKPADYTAGIDPGMAHVGVAWGWFGHLEGCAAFSRPKNLARESAAYMAAWYADQVRRRVDLGCSDICIEHMQRGKSTLEDLLNVQTVGAWLAGRLSTRGFRTVTPTEWKGQLPKEVTFGRIRTKLSAEELKNLERSLSSVPSSDHEHALDAVGIWLYSVGRMKRGM